MRWQTSQKGGTGKELGVNQAENGVFPHRRPLVASLTPPQFNTFNPNNRFPVELYESPPLTLEALRIVELQGPH